MELHRRSYIQELTCIILHVQKNQNSTQLVVPYFKVHTFIHTASQLLEKFDFAVGGGFMPNTFPVCVQIVTVSCIRMFKKKVY